MTAGEVLDRLKRKAEDYSGFVSVMRRDHTLRKLVMAWPALDVGKDPSPDDPCHDSIKGPAQARWLFARIEPDPIPRWIAVAGLPDVPHVRATCYLAIDNRLVMADGTLPEPVKAYVLAQGDD